jgi:hypothetical protein
LNEPGSALLDDLALVAGTVPAAGFNYLRNGDFEAPLDTGVTNSWKIGTNAYGNSGLVSDLVHGGAGAFKLVGTNSAGQVNPPSYSKVVMQVLSPASAEGSPATASTNTLSFWYWATNSATNLAVRIRNSSALSTAGSGPGNAFTNINIFVAPATNFVTPGTNNLVVTALPAFPPLWLNEVQAGNVTGRLDSQGEREPWIELYNSSTNPVSLEGLYLSVGHSNYLQWAFPAGSSIGPTQFLVVVCDGETNETTGAEYHTSFRLPPVSGSVALARNYAGGPASLNGPQVLDYVNYAGLHSDRSYGSFPDGQPFERQEFFYVTPGGTNDGRSAPLVVFINEYVAQNNSVLADPADGHFEDWFELYNPATNAVDLAGYFLTDTLADKFKFAITTNMAHLIPPQGHLLVWADNETGQNLSGGVPRSDLHVNYALNGTGEAHGLFAADGTQIDAIAFGGQIPDVSQGRYPDGAAAIYFMSNATPRQPNYLPQPSNTAPVLDPIGPKILYLGQTLAFLATASDADVPAQVLTFTLDAPALGAVITSGGAFTWTPGSVGTNTLTVRVSDSGVPGLDDSETITVEVLAAPAFTSTVRSGDEVTLTWGTRAGKTYAVDYKDDLNAPLWTPLWTNPASGDTLTYTTATTNAPNRFFRIRTVE